MVYRLSSLRSYSSSLGWMILRRLLSLVGRLDGIEKGVDLGGLILVEEWEVGSSLITPLESTS